MEERERERERERRIDVGCEAIFHKSIRHGEEQLRRRTSAFWARFNLYLPSCS